MRRSYVVLVRLMLIYEYEVPGKVLNLSSTKLRRPWSPWESSPSRKNPHGRTGNQTRDLMFSSQKLWPLDHEAGPFKSKYTTEHSMWFAIEELLDTQISSHPTFYRTIFNTVLIKSLHWLPVLSRVNNFRKPPHVSLRSVCNCVLLYTPMSSMWNYSFRFSTRTLHALLLCPMHAAYRINLNLFD
jgi:hypothetical protein